MIYRRSVLLAHPNHVNVGGGYSEQHGYDVIEHDNKVSTPWVEGDSEEPSTVKVENYVDDRSPHRNVQPIYAGQARIADWNIKPTTGMTAIFLLIDADPNSPNPFKGMKVGRSSGHRIHMAVTKPSDEDEDISLYAGEGMLSWWSEDPSNGMKATLRFDNGPDGAEKHPLDGMWTGTKDGAVVYLVCWAVADDETLSKPEVAKRSAPKPFSQMSAVRQSALKCERDTDFQKFCREELLIVLGDDAANADFPDVDLDPAGFAATVVRTYCGVTSRSQLGQDTAEGYAARKKWNEVLERYSQWQRGWRLKR